MGESKFRAELRVLATGGARGRRPGGLISARAQKRHGNSDADLFRTTAKSLAS